jgi:hypothetical protein
MADHRHFNGRESNYNFTTPDRAEGGRIVFPFEAIKVEFLLQAA